MTRAGVEAGENRGGQGAGTAVNTIGCGLELEIVNMCCRNMTLGGIPESKLKQSGNRQNKASVQDG